MRPRLPVVVMALAALAGLFFTGWSTLDFVAHLDRQVHAIHCSFVPGLAAPDVSGASGCHTALMSPYSSVFRTALWGGLPVTLPGMAVFAYLLYRAIDAGVRGLGDEVGLARFTVAAWLLPVLTSVGFGWIALMELGELCKLCVGIYGSSAVGFLAAIAGLVTAGRPAFAVDEEDEATEEQAAVQEVPGFAVHAGRFGEGVLFVAAPVVLYLAMAPDFSSYVGACGSLPETEDRYDVLVPLGTARGGVPAIEVLDPLCPACAGMEDRLEASGLDVALDRRAALFPLDDTCNWMVSSALHPGACTVSEAVLCAGDEAPAVLAWAFEQGSTLRAAEAAEEGAAAKAVLARFPQLKRCLGSTAVKQRLNRSLRWIVRNELPVLTPQLFVDGVKVCDDDTDLGLDWTLTRLVERARGGR
ncbi:MAG: hypothetical protein KC656_26015 [Myxococcales bacterium]|nr:hypothetical protein [Myxococcales bacterium]MCB9663351.1 hypothetical protein [Alphaproteobacteria bacterium]